MANLTYEDYKQRLNIQDVLVEAGYVRNRRDGLRYPSYVRLDEDGRRIRGDKFIVTQNSQCCFHPPVQKSYNIISFIKEHPELFRDYTAGMNLDLLVNKVCCKLLNTTYEEHQTEVREPVREPKSFELESYEIHRFEGRDKESQKAFYPYFKHRGIDLSTQFAFRRNFVLASRTTSSGSSISNLSFPLTIPGKDDTVVGFEERGRMRRDGEKAYKGKTGGSNASEGLWIASPAETKLENAGRILLFESAYDAMAYYQLKRNNDKEIKDAVFVSTGGTPTVSQMRGLIRTAPSADFHLCFDIDDAGKQFTENFIHELPVGRKAEREVPKDGYKDWNDELLGEMEETTKKAVGSDIDGDGEVEIEESNEEKHHYHR